MNPKSSVTLLATAVVALIGPAGCGSDKHAAPSAPTATFTFSAMQLKPATVRLPAATTSARLVLVSGDGRPHAAVVDAGGTRHRLVVPPSGQAAVQLRGLQSGRTYRVVPDGATEPVALVIGLSEAPKTAQPTACACR